MDHLEALRQIRQGNYNVQLEHEDELSKEILAIADRCRSQALELEMLKKAEEQPSRMSMDQWNRVCEVLEGVTAGNLFTIGDEENLPSKLKVSVAMMVDRLTSFATELVRVATEVGRDGMLGSQAVVPFGSGIWKEVTDAVNTMAFNYALQVGSIGEVICAVSNGDLSKKVDMEARGECLQLNNYINDMVAKMRCCIEEITEVSRAVGLEGTLGRQATIKVTGCWKDLRDSVNDMASSLTSQVRMVSELATHITKGDLTRYCTLEVYGEANYMKMSLNYMVYALKDVLLKKMAATPILKAGIMSWIVSAGCMRVFTHPNLHILDFDKEAKTASTYHKRSHHTDHLTSEELLEASKNVESNKHLPSVTSQLVVFKTLATAHYNSKDLRKSLQFCKRVLSLETEESKRLKWYDRHKKIVDQLLQDVQSASVSLPVPIWKEIVMCIDDSYTACSASQVCKQWHTWMKEDHPQCRNSNTNKTVP